MNFLVIGLLATLSLPAMAAEGGETAKSQARLQAQDEKRLLTEPKRGVPLLWLAPLNLTPALAVIPPKSQMIYFSEHLRAGRCYGKNIWAVKLYPSTLEERLPEQLFEIGCVLDLNYIESMLTVRYIGSDNRVHFGTIHEGKISPVLNPSTPNFPWGIWQWNSDLIEGLPGSLGKPSLHEAAWMAARWNKETISFIALRGNEPMMYRMSLTQTDNEKESDERSLAPKNIEIEPDRWRQFMFAADGSYYATFAASSSDANRLGGLCYGKAPSEQPQCIGQKSPYQGFRSVWDEQKAEEWSPRSIDYATQTPSGVVTADQSALANLEFATVSYFSPHLETPTVYRLKQLPSNEISGVSYLHGGLLITFPKERLIAWFGDKNPFTETIYPSRKPNLDVITRSEYQKLQGEVP